MYGGEDVHTLLALSPLIPSCRKEGIKGFFRGAGPNALKVIPSSVINYYVYQQVKEILRNK